jgi:hypothetical protein
MIRQAPRKAERDGSIEYNAVVSYLIQTKERLRLGLRLTPHQTAKARADILRIVQEDLSLAREVLEGKIKWNTPQTVLFLRLLNKVIPPAVEPQPEPGGNTNLPNFSVADLRRMLAETLGGDGMPEGDLASAPAAPEPYRERDRREYYKNYESLHSERKKQREEGRRRRQKSLAEVRARIRARKAREAAEIVPTRAEDDAERRALARRVKKERWQKAEREIRQAQKRKGSRDRHAGPRQAACTEKAGPRQSDRPRSGLVVWRGVRLDQWDTPLTHLAVEATGGQPLE